jgi:hypothetical protein
VISVGRKSTKDSNGGEIPGVRAGQAVRRALVAKSVKPDKIKVVCRSGSSETSPTTPRLLLLLPEIQVLNPPCPPSDRAVSDFVGKDTVGQRDLVIDLAQIEAAHLVLQPVGVASPRSCCSSAMRSESQISKPAGVASNVMSFVSGGGGPLSMARMPS